MKSYMKWIQERPLPLFMRDMQARYATPDINQVAVSRVAQKVRHWIEARPKAEGGLPILAHDVAQAIHETTTAVGLALSELGYSRRRGGRTGDPVRYRDRRVWVMGSDGQ
jgi:hypothetical protein